MNDGVVPSLPLHDPSLSSMPSRESVEAQVRVGGAPTEPNADQDFIEACIVHGMPLTLSQAQRIAFDNSERKGFHEDDGPPYPRGYAPGRARMLAVKLALIHSEVSEALEALRVSGGDIKHGYAEAAVGDPVPKPCGFPSEIADIVIRCLDLAGIVGFDLEQEVLLKMRFNALRPAMHWKVF